MTTILTIIYAVALITFLLIRWGIDLKRDFLEEPSDKLFFYYNIISISLLALLLIILIFIR